MFDIIKTLHKERVNNFPLFDDDKPNDHIDIKGESMLVPNSQAIEEKKWELEKKILNCLSKAVFLNPKDSTTSPWFSQLTYPLAKN